jgi:hypothetical protein
MHSFTNLFSGSWAMPGTGYSPMGSALLIIVVIWSLVWKGFALWRAAENRSKIWFIFLLVLNTVGILEILYLFVFSKKKPMSQSPAPTEEKK